MSDADLNIEDTAPRSKGEALSAFHRENIRGTCRTCGQPARSPSSFYCEEHAPAAKAKARVKEWVGGSSGETAPGKAVKDSAPRKGRQPSLRGEIQTFYEVLGEMVGFASPRVGAAISGNATQAAIAWDAKAKSNASIYKFWSNASDVSGWGAIVFAHTPILFAVRDEMRERAVIGAIRNEAASLGGDPDQAEQMARSQAAAAGMDLVAYAQMMAQQFQATQAADGAPAPAE